MAAHLQGREDEARRFLVDALKIDPALTAASLLLGNVLYQAGDIDGAIDVYQQALTHAPDHPQLTKQLDAWRKEAALHSGFGRKLGDHFTVLFEGPAEAELADRAVAILESAYWRIGTALYTYPADVITVILYTREQFRDITQSPEWAAGAFDGRIRLPVQGALQNRAQFERVLSHEFTHALIQSVASRGVPFWLHEGLAVCFEGSDLARKEEQVRQAETRLAAHEARAVLRRPVGDKRVARLRGKRRRGPSRFSTRPGAPAVVNLLGMSAAACRFPRPSSGTC